MISVLSLCLLLCQFDLLFPLQGHRRLWRETEMFLNLDILFGSLLMSLFRLMFLLFLPEQRLVFLFLCGVHCDISLFTASSRPSLSFLSCLNLSPSSHPLSSASSSLFTMFFFPSFILTTTLSLISLCLVPFDFQVGNWKSYFTFHPLFSFALSVFPLCVYSLHFNFLLQPLSFVL